MNAARRRAFALMMAVMVFAVGTIMVAVMLERQGSSILTTRRHLDQHVGHHASRGLQECIGQYVLTFQNTSLESNIAPDGRLVDFVLDDGRTIRVFLLDGQASLLNDLTALRSDEDERDATAALNALRDILGRRRPTPEMLRRYGPVAVSAHGANETVLEAACSAALDRGSARRLAREIIVERSRGPLDAAKLNEVVGRVVADPASRAKVDRVVTLEPVVWNTRVEVVRPNLAGRDAVTRYRGVLRLLARGQGRRGGADPQNTTDRYSSPVVFLEWERLPDE